MAQYYHYDASKIESNHKKIGYLISGIIHALLLLLIMWRILELPVEAPQEYAIELLGPTPQYVEPIVENDPGGGNSAGPEDTAPKEGGSAGSEAPESKTPEDAVKVEDKVEEKIEPVKPAPVPTQSNPKPILTTPTPEVVKVDPPKVEHPGPVRPNPVPSNDPPVVSKPTPTTGGANGNSGRASSGDNDSPGTGGSGTGSGTGTGSGGANTGTGTGGGGGTGNGTGGGVGDGAGVDFDAIGILKRKVVSRPDIKDLARENAQSVVFNMCINREGAVTYIRYNPKMSKTKDVNFIREATKKMSQYKFQSDPKAPRKECGTYTFTTTGVIQKLN